MAEDRETVVWVRLPKHAQVADLKGLGIAEAGCYGGDTCIAATNPASDAGILVQHRSIKSPEEMMREAGLNPRADCFGGDTCIV
jgi:hypothetical protein